MAKQSDGAVLRCPLYREASQVIHARALQAHPGLWYDKFCNSWHDPVCKPNQRPTWQKPECNKVEWIRTVVREGPIGDASLISQHAGRRKRLVERLGGKCLSFQTDSRFVTGLGREHPVENGFAWHPTLGIPYLPGSSIKGMLRAWALMERQEDAANKILGHQESPEAGGGRVGTVIVFDAIPVGPVRLEVDVMTPHYADYYERGDAPGDWLSPRPVPFLVVASCTAFQFAIAPRAAEGKEHLESVAKWLKDALQWIGAGAKTAVGYGRFEVGKSEVEKPVCAPPTPAKVPRYEPGKVITVTRAEDPNPKPGKSRIWFVADDGFGGVVTGGTPPDIQIGESTQLEVAAVMQHRGYNFRLPRGGARGRK